MCKEITEYIETKIYSLPFTTHTHTPIHTHKSLQTITNTHTHTHTHTYAHTNAPMPALCAHTWGWKGGGGNAGTGKKMEMRLRKMCLGCVLHIHCNKFGSRQLKCSTSHSLPSLSMCRMDVSLSCCRSGIFVDHSYFSGNDNRFDCTCSYPFYLQGQAGELCGPMGGLRQSSRVTVPVAQRHRGQLAG